MSKYSDYSDYMIALRQAAEHDCYDTRQRSDLLALLRRMASDEFSPAEWESALRPIEECLSPLERNALSLADRLLEADREYLESLIDVDDTKLVASAKAFSNAINDPKLLKLIAKIRNGQSISDHEFGTFVGVEKALMTLMQQLEQD